MSLRREDYRQVLRDLFLGLEGLEGLEDRGQFEHIDRARNARVRGWAEIS